MEKLSESGTVTYMIVMSRADLRRVRELARWNVSKWVREATKAALDAHLDGVTRPPFVLAGDRERLGFSIDCETFAAVDADRARPEIGGCPRSVWFHAAILRHLEAAEAAK